MLHSEAIVYSKEWTMASSVQPSVVSGGDHGRPPRAEPYAKVSGLVRVPVEQSGER
jgi:hypothetical protein